MSRTNNKIIIVNSAFVEGIFHCMAGSKNVQAGTFTNIKIDMSSSTLRTEGEMFKA